MAPPPGGGPPGTPPRGPRQRRERDQPRRPRGTARRRRPRPGHLRPAVAGPRHGRGRGPRRGAAPRCLRRHRGDRVPAGAGNVGAAVRGGLCRRIPLAGRGGGDRGARRGPRADRRGRRRARAAGGRGGQGRGGAGRAQRRRGGGKERGDLDTASAARFLDALADRIAIGVASVVAVLDPGCVVLGGEVGQAGGEALAGRVEERVRRMAPLATVVRPSSLGGEAVLRGALLTARDAAQDELFAPRDR